MPNSTNSIIKISTLLRKADGINKERVKFHGLEDLETYILIHLDIIDCPSQKNLCDKFKVPKQTINNVIINLRNDDLIFFESDKNDKRKKIIRLTKKGEKKRKEILDLLNESDRMIYEDLGYEKASEIIANLELLIDIIKKNINKEV